MKKQSPSEIEKTDHSDEKLTEDWKVYLTPKTERELKKLPKRVQEIFHTLTGEMAKLGPVRKAWPSFGSLHKQKKKIPDNSYHCHLKRGNPTYVVCWSCEKKGISKKGRVKIIKKIKIIEVYYVGTHEGAPYQKH